MIVRGDCPWCPQLPMFPATILFCSYLRSFPRLTIDYPKCYCTAWNHHFSYVLASVYPPRAAITYRYHRYHAVAPKKYRTCSVERYQYGTVRTSCISDEGAISTDKDCKDTLLWCCVYFTYIFYEHSSYIPFCVLLRIISTKITCIATAKTTHS